jgi:hypothetical protein
MVRISHTETNVKSMGNSQHIHIKNNAKPDCNGERGLVIDISSENLKTLITVTY